MIAKKRHRFVFTLVVAAASVQASLGQQLLQQPQEGVLLLKHGTTLSGFITPAGDRYVVLLGESGEARVPATDVVAFVSNLQQAYEFKRSNLNASLASRIDLAQWCLQHDMPARAADQLLAAERLFGRQPQLESLHQRLIAAANRRVQREILRAKTPPSPKPVSTSLSMPFQASRSTCLLQAFNRCC